MATKSLVIQVGVDTAGKAHNCQANARHRIAKGDTRLKVRNGRGWDHYCRDCAVQIISRDIAKLTALQSLPPTATKQSVDAL
jgi:hypothetical protein